jgi:hypothetical protein
VAVTTVSTLLAVVLGGWLTLRGQDRHWKREQARQWRDMRLQRYTEFLTAFREYVSYILLPTAQVIAVRRAKSPHDLMPFFDETGTRYKEKLEAAKTAVRLVSERPQLIEASKAMVQHARSLAAERATVPVESMPPEKFALLWSAERAFVSLARTEVGLDEEFDFGLPAPELPLDAHRFADGQQWI